MKRKKFEIAAELEKVKRENIALHDANQQLQLQQRLKKGGNSGSIIDQLMATDPDIARELKSVAQLQN